MNKRIAISLGDPGGIGPDICVMMASNFLKKNHIIITDPQLLIDSSKKLKTKIIINELEDLNSKPKGGKSVINVLPVKLNVRNKPGYMNPDNASFVIKVIETAAYGCFPSRSFNCWA